MHVVNKIRCLSGDIREKKRVLINYAILSAIFGISLCGCIGMIQRATDNIAFTLESVDLNVSPIEDGVNIIGAIFDNVMGERGRVSADFQINAALLVSNNNAFAVDISHITYTVFINGREFGSGDLIAMNDELRLYAKSERRIKLPLKVPYAKLPAHVLRGLRARVMDAQVRGEVTVNTSTGLLKLPFKAQLLKVESIK